jgi:hypothetical protein
MENKGFALTNVRTFPNQIKKCMNLNLTWTSIFLNLDICILSRFILLRTNFIQVQPISEKARAKDRKCDGVGVMKDKELKLEDVKTPHTLG